MVIAQWYIFNNYCLVKIWQISYILVQQIVTHINNGCHELAWNSVLISKTRQKTSHHPTAAPYCHCTLMHFQQFLSGVKIWQSISYLSQAKSKLTIHKQHPVATPLLQFKKVKNRLEIWSVVFCMRSALEFCHRLPQVNSNWI